MHSANWIARDRYAERPDARRFETWEYNVAAKLGLGSAIDYALEWGLPAIRDRVFLLADHLRSALAELPGVKVRDLGAHRCGIVTFTVAGLPGTHVMQLLTRRGINVSVSCCPSTRIDMESRGLDEVVRASVHYYNTVHEVNALRDAVWDMSR